MNTRFLRSGIFTLVLVVGIAAVLYMFLFDQPKPATIPYSGGAESFLGYVSEGAVKSVEQSGNALKITLEENDPKTNTNKVVSSQVPGQLGQGLLADITAVCAQAGSNCNTDMQISASEPDGSGQLLGILLTTALPIIVIGAILFFMLRQAQGTNNQAMSFGKSRARMFLGNKTVVTFADVAGVDEAKMELQEIVEFLKYPEKFNSLGARIPRGVLLVGPPGTGKTLLARAVAGEAGVPFFSISGSEFVEMFVGVGASRVRDLFDQAKRNSPCIVFVDEIDAVGRQRGAGLGGSHDEREQTLNQILVEMDGFDTNTNVIVVAATNRPDVLDPALLRPGRFDRQVILDRPDMKGRLEILKVHVKGKPLDKAIDLQPTSPSSSPGFSGADLANLVNEAAILAARRNKKVISTPEFSEALERVVAGPERKSRVISDAEKADHRLPRGRPRRRPAHPAQVRSGGQGQHHQPGHGPRLHDGPADRGPLPPEQDRVRRQDRGHARRQRGREAHLRRHHDRRLERHREGHQPRPADGHRVRHEREARPAGASASARRWSSSVARSASSATTPTRSHGRSTRKSAPSSTAATPGRWRS